MSLTALFVIIYHIIRDKYGVIHAWRFFFRIHKSLVIFLVANLFFCITDGIFSGVYYNFEFSCIGKIFAASGFVGDRTLHTEQSLATIFRYVSSSRQSSYSCSHPKRKSTLGTETFEERKISEEWQIVVRIPKEVRIVVNTSYFFSLLLLFLIIYDTVF